MTPTTPKPYYSGDPALQDIRIDPTPPKSDGPAPIRMIARLPSEECGCPEELWQIDGLYLLFHFEEDGSSDAFIFAGDWEAETNLEARSLNDLRSKSFQWFADVMDGCA